MNGYRGSLILSGLIGLVYGYTYSDSGPIIHLIVAAGGAILLYKLILEGTHSSDCAAGSSFGYLILLGAGVGLGYQQCHHCLQYPSPLD